MTGTTGSRRRTRTTPAMTMTRPPRRGWGQSINERGDRKGRGGRQRQNGKSSLPALTPSLPARSSMFTPARSPMSMLAHPHTIPFCPYAHRPADSTCTPTRIDSHPSHAHPHHQHQWSRQPPHHQFRRPWQPPPAPTLTTMVATPRPSVYRCSGHPQPVSLPPSLHFLLHSSSILMPTHSVSFFFPDFYSLHPQLQCCDDDNCPPSLWPCGS